MGLPPGWGQLKFGVAVGEGVAVAVGVWVGEKMRAVLPATIAGMEKYLGSGKTHSIHRQRL